MKAHINLFPPYERGRRQWYERCVLRSQPAFCTIALSPGHFLGYASLGHSQNTHRTTLVSYVHRFLDCGIKTIENGPYQSLKPSRFSHKVRSIRHREESPCQVSEVLSHGRALCPLCSTQSVQRVNLALVIGCHGARTGSHMGQRGCICGNALTECRFHYRQFCSRSS